MSHFHLLIWDEAEDDIFDTRQWYDNQREGLGDQFLLEVERAIEEVRAAPLRFPRVEGPIRRAIVSRFPYCVFYRIQEQTLEILGIVHQSRDPKVWRQRSR